MNNRIKKIREDKKMSQEVFGKKLMITKASVSRLESGVNNPSDQTLKLICSEFNVNENWLRTGEGEPYIQLEVNDTISRTAELLGKHDPFLESFLEVYGKMSDSARAVMIDTLEEIFEIYKSKKE